MWWLIPEGFYSIVQKEGEVDLCIRARDRVDLDRLRDAYMPGLGPTKETPGGDYRYRAWVSRDAFADGLAAFARSLDYPNFKDEAGRRDPQASAQVPRRFGKRSARSSRAAPTASSETVRRRI